MEQESKLTFARRIYSGNMSWTIENFLGLEHTFELVLSEKLKTNSCGTWQLGLIPDCMIAPGCLHSTAFLLENRGVLTNFRATANISILDQKKIPIQGNLQPIVVTTSECTSDEWTSGIFFASKTSFFSQLNDEDKASLGRDYRYVVNGRLHISAQIEVLTLAEGNEKRHSELAAEVCLVEDIKQLFESKKGSDLTVISSDGKEISAHWSILLARSDAFATTLTTTVVGRCSVQDLDGETLTGMLEFMYGRTPEKLSELAEKLLYAGEKYGIPGLKEMCGEHLAKVLDLSNATRILILAHQHSTNQLRQAVFTYIGQHKQQFLEGSGMEEIWSYDTKLGKDLVRHISQNP